MNQIMCCACREDADDMTAVQAVEDGWVYTARVWTCPDCAEEYRASQQDAYDDANPPLAAPWEER